LRSASACFPRDCTTQARLSRRGWLRSREWERITRGVYAAALSRTQFEELAAWQLVLAQNRRFLAPDGRSTQGLVAAGRRRTSGLRCDAQRRFPSPAAWAAGMPPHPAVPDERGQRAAGQHGCRDDPRCRSRPRCARCGHPRRFGTAAAALHPDRPRNHGPSAAARCTSTATGHPAARCAERVRLGVEPLPKPVRCNKEKAAIWVVRDRLREDGSGALLAAFPLGELLPRHQGR
jgi:hypothetical protein